MPQGSAPFFRQDIVGSFSYLKRCIIYIMEAKATSQNYSTTAAFVRVEHGKYLFLTTGNSDESGEQMDIGYFDRLTILLNS